jgi:hypothetical protein
MKVYCAVLGLLFASSPGLLLAAWETGPAAPQSPGAAAENGNPNGALTFHLTEATVTKASQKVFTGLKIDPVTGNLSLIFLTAEPKAGHEFVLLKIAVHNNGAQTDRVVYQDLAIKGADGKPIDYLVQVNMSSDPSKSDLVYSPGVTMDHEIKPQGNDSINLMLNAPISHGNLRLQYRSQPAVWVDLGTPGLTEIVTRYKLITAVIAGCLVLASFALLWLWRKRAGKPVAQVSLGLLDNGDESLPTPPAKAD